MVDFEELYARKWKALLENEPHRRRLPRGRIASNQVQPEDQERVLAAVREKPDLSCRALARELGVSHPVVARARRQVEGRA